MANTLTVAGHTITITLDGGAEDLDFATYFPTGVRINNIDFIASNAADVFVLNNKTASGGNIVKFIGSHLVTYTDPPHMHPFFDYSDCTFNTPASCSITIELA